MCGESSSTFSAQSGGWTTNRCSWQRNVGFHRALLHAELCFRRVLLYKVFQRFSCGSARSCIGRGLLSVTHLKTARPSDHSANGRRRFSFGLSLMKCWPANTKAAYRPQNTNDLVLWTTKHKDTKHWATVPLQKKCFTVSSQRRRDRRGLTETHWPLRLPGPGDEATLVWHCLTWLINNLWCSSDVSVTAAALNDDTSGKAASWTQAETDDLRTKGRLTSVKLCVCLSRFGKRPEDGVARATGVWNSPSAARGQSFCRGSKRCRKAKSYSLFASVAEAWLR